ncbi:MAG TPA: hypothetical protein VJG90_09050 [Candidatus Nanoarchaeia archaeon]|nr:hypothetical protein [Candidatus Nanoarchaeia archaeon]
MQKKGIELSINMLVVLILSIVIFGGGIAIFYKAFAKGQEQVYYLDQASQRQIENALDDGSLVAIPISSKTIERNGHATFGIGVTNEKGSTHNFALAITYATGEPASANGNSWIKNHEWGNPVPLQNGEKKVFNLYLVPNGANQKGTHIFNVVACYDGPDSGTSSTGASLCASSGALYENLHKIYLIIS